jgi:hypothetical protein
LFDVFAIIGVVGAVFGADIVWDKFINPRLHVRPEAAFARPKDTNGETCETLKL